MFIKQRELVHLLVLQRWLESLTVIYRYISVFSSHAIVVIVGVTVWCIMAESS